MKTALLTLFSFTIPMAAHAQIDTTAWPRRELPGNYQISYVHTNDKGQTRAVSTLEEIMSLHSACADTDIERAVNNGRLENEDAITEGWINLRIDGLTKMTGRVDALNLKGPGIRLDIRRNDQLNQLTLTTVLTGYRVGNSTQLFGPIYTWGATRVETKLFSKQMLREASSCLRSSEINDFLLDSEGMIYEAIQKAEKPAQENLAREKIRQTLDGVLVPPRLP